SFVSMLPRSESPEATDGYYGYFCPLDIKGDPEKTVVEVFLRDFEQAGMDRRLSALEAFARATDAQFPGGAVNVVSSRQYLNMKKKLDEHPLVLDLLLKAAQAAGTDAFFKPIRGGTDGARLTQMGIPTPNVFTGGHNYHSRYEWAGLGEMIAAVQTILELVRLWARRDATAQTPRGGLGV
ncbi:MAG: peptidase T, partial [Treponemataceae bacterium]